MVYFRVYFYKSGQVIEIITIIMYLFYYYHYLFIFMIAFNADIIRFSKAFGSLLN